MASLLRVSEAAALGLHTAVYLAAHPGGRHSVGEVARELNVSENHLSKVCQRLVHEGVLRAVRGPGGGISLARPADQVTLLDVYEAIEGPMGTSYCLLGRELCSSETCVMGGLVESVHRQVEEYFAHTTVAAIGSTDPLVARDMALITGGMKRG